MNFFLLAHRLRTLAVCMAGLSECSVVGVLERVQDTTRDNEKV